MSKKPTKQKVEFLLLSPEMSYSISLSEAWHYSFDVDVDISSASWQGPFTSKEDAEKAAVKALEEAAAATVAGALFGDAA